MHSHFVDFTYFRYWSLIFTLSLPPPFLLSSSVTDLPGRLPPPPPLVFGLGETFVTRKVTRTVAQIHLGHAQNVSSNNTHTQFSLSLSLSHTCKCALYHAHVLALSVLRVVAHLSFSY